MLTKILFNSIVNLALLFVLLFTGCIKHEAIQLETKKMTLEYSEYLESYLGIMGLIDITKIDQVEEIEEINIKYSRIPSSFFVGQIIILDANGNNSFVDDSIDFVGLGNVTRKIDFQTINFIKYKQPIIVKLCHELFTLNIHEDGNKIELNKVQESISEYDLTYPYKLPDKEIDGLNQKITLNKSNGKYTYIEFWGTWCKPCIKLIPELKTLNKYYSDRLNLISIDYRDKDIEKVRKVVEILKMDWDQGVADKTLEKSFGDPNFVPCGILFNPDGYLVKYGILPEDVKAYLKIN